MRLTNSDRDAFVRAVMDDTPSINYAEQIESAALAFIKDQIPDELRPLIDKYPDSFAKTVVYISNAGSTVVRGLADDYNWDKWRKRAPKELLTKLEKLAGRAEEQAKERAQLKIMLRGAIYACSTLKRAQEALPEFAKYLPTERTKTGVTNLPTINTEDLLIGLKKLGWPKQNKK